MLSQSLIKSTNRLEELELQDFHKVINYAINLLLNKDNQMKLNQFIQIQEEYGDHLTQITLALITTLSQYRSGAKEMSQDLSLLMLSQQKLDYFKEKLENNLYQLRKVIYGSSQENRDKVNDPLRSGLNDEVIKVNWRLQAQIASKSQKNCFKPNFQIMLTVPSANTVANDGQKHKICTFNSTYANMKNLYDNLQQAMKMHNSSKTKMARLSSV